LREIIADGVEGLLFAPRDPGALVAAVLRLIDDPALRRRLGDAAAARARLSLSWEDNARRVVRACEECLRRSQGRPPTDLPPAG
jgi:glycosyltransferase involved in cell wall biosynthesis